MNKKDAKTISVSGITAGEIKAMLKAAYVAGAADSSRSVVNRSGASKGTTYNIFWGAYKDVPDDKKIKGLECLGAKNAIWEFGDYWTGWRPEKKKVSKKKLPQIYHEEPESPF